jgi:hypothetical protein
VVSVLNAVFLVFAVLAYVAGNYAFFVGSTAVIFASLSLALIAGRLPLRMAYSLTWDVRDRLALEAEIERDKALPFIPRLTKNYCRWMVELCYTAMAVLAIPVYGQEYWKYVFTIMAGSVFMISADAFRSWLQIRERRKGTI